MCGMNLAFNRELIGPSMYFGLMGDGQPLGRYDDMWAGWCSKVTLLSPLTSCSVDQTPQKVAKFGCHLASLPASLAGLFMG